MTVVLLRHASAGQRDFWTGPDALRPLDARGWAQAESLASTLEPLPDVGLLSSPATRCRQTLEPLARARGLPIEDVPELAEGSSEEAVSLLRSLAKSNVVICTHGDIVPALLDHIVRFEGVEVPDTARWPKASAWLLEADPSTGRYISARYLPPPAIEGSPYPP